MKVRRTPECRTIGKERVWGKPRTVIRGVPVVYIMGQRPVRVRVYIHDYNMLTPPYSRSGRLADAKTGPKIKKKSSR